MLLLLRVLIIFFYRFSDYILVVSDFLIDDLSKAAFLPKQRIRRIYNPIVDSEFEAQSREMVRHPWLLEKKNPVVLAIGRLAREKNFSLLLRTFSTIHKSIPDARLIILG